MKNWPALLFSKFLPFLDKITRTILIFQSVDTINLFTVEHTCVNLFDRISLFSFSPSGVIACRMDTSNYTSRKWATLYFSKDDLCRYVHCSCDF